MQTRVLILALAFISGLGPKSIKKILSAKIPIHDWWYWPLAKQQTIPWIKTLGKRWQPQSALKKAQSITTSLDNYQISFISLADNDYPLLLKEIADPPPILYYKGKIKCVNQQRCLAVVGARRISPYARQVMPRLLNPLLEQNIILVSGLAIGVDSYAHQLAIQANQPTIAVLGGGLDDKSLYPGQHLMLSQQIIKQGGLLLSEYPPLTRPLPANFPRRNRIISGLSQATLVVEAAARSGSLITAYQALEQNRDVLAVPGAITLTNCQGSNRLIQQGARLVQDASDLRESLHLPNQHTTRNKAMLSLTETERSIINILAQQPLMVDKLQEYCKINIDVLNATLSLLEIKQLVEQRGSYYYSLI
ncbi:MAG: DNA-processing protein DprA [Candidatus Komeilibacteria bacterium]